MRAGRRRGEIRERIQTNGRCESANPQGDTYGPGRLRVVHPGLSRLRLEREVGHAARRPLHVDPVRRALVVGLVLVGRRFGGTRLAAALAFAWAAYPFTQYASNSNTNDALHAVLPHLGVLARLVARRSRRVRRAVGLDEVRRARRRAVVAHVSGSAAVPPLRAGFAVATLAAFSVVLLEPSPLHALRVFWHRTVSLADRPRLAVLALGLGAVLRPRAPGPAPRAARAAGGPRRRRAGAGVLPAPEVAAAARRADRGAARSASSSC